MLNWTVPVRGGTVPPARNAALGAQRWREYAQCKPLSGRCTQTWPLPARAFVYSGKRETVSGSILIRPRWVWRGPALEVGSETAVKRTRVMNGQVSTFGALPSPFCRPPRPPRAPSLVRNILKAATGLRLTKSRCDCSYLRHTFCLLTYVPP